MSLHRATRDLSAPTTSSSEEGRQPAGPVVLFIGAVLIAGMTCILYLWQQSQIVAGKQDLSQLNSTLTVLVQQRGDLLAQKQNLTSVIHVVAQANRYGMQQGDPRTFKRLTVPITPHDTTAVAQAGPGRQPAVLLPATNAAITSWWQDAWDGLYNLLQ